VTVLLPQSVVFGSGGVPNASMFALISSILRLSHGFSGYAVGNGWFAPVDPLGPELLFALANARVPAIFLAPWRASARSIPPAPILSLALTALIAPAVLLVPGQGCHR
jgi:hypothetical protein